MPSATCIKEPGSNQVVNLSEANNYSFSNALTVATTSVKANSFLTVDWSGVTEDFLTQPLDPLADVDMVSVVLFSLTHDQIIEDLNADALGDRAVEGGVFKPTGNTVTSTSTQGTIIKGNTQAQADEDILLGFDPVTFPPDQFTYAFMLNNGFDFGAGVKMIHTVKLDPATENTTITITNTSTVVNYEADLHSKPALQLPSNTGALFLDWSQLTTNALGRMFTPRHVEEVRLIHVAKTPAEIEGEFLRLEILGDKNYTGVVCEDGKFAMSGMTDETGAAFQGFDPALGGTWLLALMCPNKCGNPAPWYMTRLEAAP